MGHLSSLPIFSRWGGGVSIFLCCLLWSERLVERSSRSRRRRWRRVLANVCLPLNMLGKMKLRFEASAFEIKPPKSPELTRFVFALWRFFQNFRLWSLFGLTDWNALFPLFFFILTINFTFIVQSNGHETRKVCLRWKRCAKSTTHKSLYHFLIQIVVSLFNIIFFIINEIYTDLN